MLRRIKVMLALAAAMTMLLVVVGAAPAMADDIDRQCFPFCDGHNHNDFDNFDHHDFVNFDHNDFDEFDIDDCELAFIDGDDELVWVCEVDFD